MWMVELNVTGKIIILLEKTQRISSNLAKSKDFKKNRTQKMLTMKEIKHIFIK